MPLFRKCNKSVSILLLTVFLLFIHNLFWEETIKQQFQPILMFPCPINIFSAFLLKNTPGILVQTNGLDYQCNGHWANQKSGPNVTSYHGEVVEGPVITLPILPKRPFIGAQLYFILWLVRGTSCRSCKMKLCSWWRFTSFWKRCVEILVGWTADFT